MITWITKNVAIGEYSDAINEELLGREKIDCVLNVKERDEASMIEHAMERFHGIKYFHVSVGSHQGLTPIKIELRTATYMLEQLAEKYKRILVHCMGGIDRSPFVVAYWQVIYNGKDICETKVDLKFWISAVYKVIREKRPQVIEHLEWV